MATFQRNCVCTTKVVLVRGTSQQVDCRDGRLSGTGRNGKCLASDRGAVAGRPSPELHSRGAMHLSFGVEPVLGKSVTFNAPALRSDRPADRVRRMGRTT